MRQKNLETQQPRRVRRLKLGYDDSPLDMTLSNDFTWLTINFAFLRVEVHIHECTNEISEGDARK